MWEENHVSVMRIMREIWKRSDAEVREFSNQRTDIKKHQNKVLNSLGADASAVTEIGEEDARGFEIGFVEKLTEWGSD